MSLTAEERMGRFIAMPKDRALNRELKRDPFSAPILCDLLHTGPKLELNEKLKAFERKCEDIKLAIDHLCTIAPERQDELLAELSSMTVEKIEIDSEICEVYTAAPPETQNFLEPIKIAPNDIRENKVKIRTMVEDYERSMIGEESQKANQVQKTNRKPQAQQDQKQRIPIELQGKCFKCAKEGHKAGECRLSPDTKCTSCGRLGYIAKACISSRMNKKQNSPPARAAKEVKKGKPDASDADDENEDTEKAKVVVVHRTMKRGDSPDILL